MSDNPFLRFIDLVTFDHKIQSLETEKVRVDNEISVIKKQEDQHIKDLDEMHKRIVQFKKRVDAQELEMKVLDQKEKEKKQVLERILDYKELCAIKAEIEAVQRLQVEQEQSVLDAWSQLENAQLHEHKKTAEVTDQTQALHERMKALEQKSALLHDQCNVLVLERIAKEADVPKEWLEKYSMMRSRVSDPVVEIFHGSCGACAQMLTSQDLVRAKRGALLQCQKCFRLLYAPEIMEKHEAI